MKRHLTPKESEELFMLGIDRESANSVINSLDEPSGDEYPESRVFSLADILELLPKEEIEYAWLNIDSVCGWTVEYDTLDDFGELAIFENSKFQASELIDALSQLLKWTIIRGHKRPKLESIDKEWNSMPLEDQKTAQNRYRMLLSEEANDVASIRALENKYGRHNLAKQ